jgi:chromatin licensing and DNA replication factor 1
VNAGISEILSVEVVAFRYALLEAFYEGVEAAISLLGIRRQLCTFQAVCTTVEATTQR